jgi:tetratricopeptide (TPR) repeat protein
MGMRWHARASAAMLAAMADPAALAHLELLISAHPGLLLDEDERAEFADELPDLAALVAANPDDAELLIHCAYAARKLGRFDDALAAADAALAADRTWRTVTAKATVYRAAADADRAIALFEEAAGLDPDDTAALMEGARTLGEAERFAEAAVWFERVVTRDPDRTDATLWAAYSAHCATHDPAQIARVRAILAEDPDDDLAERLLELMEQG